MSFSSKTALLVVLAVNIQASFCSCVNEDYDLTKDFDKTISIGGDIHAPIGNSETILISDLLDIDENGTGVLVVSADGDYSLHLSGNRTETGFNVPSVSITRGLVNEGGFTAGIDRSLIMSETGVISPESPLPSGLTFSRNFTPIPTPVTIDEAVPEEIVDVKGVTGKATGTVSFSANVGKATVTGLVIDFPDYLEIGDITTKSGRISYSFDKERNMLTFDPVEVSKSPNSVNLEITGIDFDKIPAGQGFMADRHRIIVNDDIKLSGFNVKVLSDDLGRTFASIPEEILVDVGINVGSIEVESATVKVDPIIDIDPKTVDVGTMPDFIDGDGTALDLYNPQIMLRVGNDSPLALTLNADLESFKGETKNTVHIGDKGGATDEIRIAAGKETRICLSATGEDVPEGYNNIKAPALPDIVKDVPERIGITNVDVKAEDEFITVRTDREYSFYCSYDVIAPLSFGSGLRFEYSYDFTGWNETFNPQDGDGKEFEIRNADVTFDFVNMIPLGISLTVSAIDKSARVIPEITVTVDGSVSSGSIERPSRNPMTMTLKSSAGDLKRLDGLRLNLEASGTDREHQGTCLNKNQGIRLENMKIRMQGSVTTEF